MKKFLRMAVVALGLLLPSVPTPVAVPLVAATTFAAAMMPEVVLADAVICEDGALATCESRAPSEHKYKGGKKKPLRYMVFVCHPDFDRLARHWFSFAFFPQGKTDTAIARLRSGRQWSEVVEAPEGQRCIEHYYEPGRVLMIVSPCRVPGKNVILVTRPLTAADHGSAVQFYEIEGSAF